MKLVKNDTRGLNGMDLHALARIRLGAMDGNPHFPNPTPSIAEFRSACDALGRAVEAITDGGSRWEYATKDKWMATVNDMMRSWASYVATMAQGNTELILSAGYEERRVPVRNTVLDRPRNVRARTGKQQGTIVVRWVPVRGARMYEVYICTGDPNEEGNWVLCALTSGSRYEAIGLAPLEYFAFRVVALGTSDKIRSIPSQPATALSIGFKAA